MKPIRKASKAGTKLTGNPGPPLPKFEVSEKEKLACGYEGKLVQAPCREEEVGPSIFQRDDGSFFLHKVIFDDEGTPTGNIKKELTKDQAVDWWIEHFFPKEFMPVTII